MRTVYLLHLSPPYKHAAHYIGVTRNGRDFVRRWLEHQHKEGARLTRVARNNGSLLILARVWLNAEFALERKLKNRGGAARLCPICRTIKRRSK